MTFKTQNIKRPSSWIKRAFFVCLFGFIFYYKFLIIFQLQELGIAIYLTSLIFIILAGQFDEIEINENKLIIKQSSIIPFLKSKRKFNIKDIDIIRKNSNYIEGEGFYSLILKNRKAVELIFTNGKSEIINSRVHPDGYYGLKADIEERINNSNN